jgi:hypothetical protein
MVTRRTCIIDRTNLFHFVVELDDLGKPVGFFVIGRGKTGTLLDEELHEMSVKASQIMRGDFDGKI